MRRGFYRVPQRERTHKTISTAHRARVHGAPRRVLADDDWRRRGASCATSRKVLGAHCDAAGITGSRRASPAWAWFSSPRTRRRRRRRRRRSRRPSRRRPDRARVARVPVNKDAVGRADTAAMIEQVLNAPRATSRAQAVRRAQDRGEDSGGIDAEMPGIAENFYVCTMSGRVIVYKGICPPSSARFTSTFRTRTSRRSFAFTTAASPRTQCRSAARAAHALPRHNGEITLQGNLNWMSKEADDAPGGTGAASPPICNPAASDSATRPRRRAAGETAARWRRP